MYIAIDNETGGLGADKVSLLSSYFAILDKDLNLVADLDLFVKPNDGIYKVEARALDINKIDLIGHDTNALTFSQAGQVLVNFLKQHSNNGAIKLIPIGHNVAFDLAFIHAQLVGRSTFEQYTSHRKIDTGAIAQFLKLAGILPDNNLGGLDALAAYYGVFQAAKHTGKGDVETTVEILRRMLQHVKGMLSTPVTTVAPLAVSIPFNATALYTAKPAQGMKI
jgi:DNA polymerase III alpha subunit (gram-positive type)